MRMKLPNSATDFCANHFVYQYLKF